MVDAGRRPLEVDMRGVVLLLGLLGVAGVASADVPRARILTRAEINAEMTVNRRLAGYIARNGYPDIAEWRFLSDEPPWDEHEVSCYYLDRRKEIAFTRAWMLGSPWIPIQRYERELTDADIAALQPLLVHEETVSTDPVTRAEAAAARAEAAVQRIEIAAAATERAADRAEAVVAKMMESEPAPGTRRHH
jgi:hypothetical protein